jgi:hypothetical protein
MAEECIVEILDPELSLRLGSLTRLSARRLEKIATHEFIAGLSQTQAFDLARAMQWLEAGHQVDCASEEMIATLALHEVSEERLEGLVADLDTAYTLTLPRQLSELQTTSPKLLKIVLLGWRVSLALELLRQYES